MRHRLGTAVLTAVIGTALLAAPAKAVDASAATSARAVDTSPPRVGSCHDLSIREAYARAEPDPAVDCSERHTTITIKIIRFGSKPNWRNTAKLNRKVQKKCSPKLFEFFGNRKRAVQLSAYNVYWFQPTKRQRRAGAKWIRCDLALYRPNSVPRLPTSGDPKLGSTPLARKVAKCRKGKRQNFAVTTCNTSHRFRATHAVRYRSNRYPGIRKIKKFAVRKCRRKLGRRLGYVESPTRAMWKGGLDRVVCLKRTRR